MNSYREGNSESLKLARARRDIYNFFASLFLQIPDLDFVKKIKDGSLLSFMNCLIWNAEAPEKLKEGMRNLREFIEASEGRSAEEMHLDISVERTRLFRGISPEYGPPPPFELVYQEGAGGERMMLTMLDLLKEYSAISFPVPPRERPDYIGVELAFMAFLCEKEIEAREGGKTANVLLDIQKKFLDEHLIRWIPRFCERIVLESKLDFYRGIVKIMACFIDMDRLVFNN